jgi:dolichol-phosphate mannosyltransferase
MKKIELDFAVVIPMANESKDFDPFICSLIDILNDLNCGKVYFVVDKVSKDNTLKLCNGLSEKDKRFVTIFSPNNKNIVDAYINGYKKALNNKHDFIIEMDAGLSHDPKSIPEFLRVLSEGNECAFGSRFIDGGSICDSSWKRTFLSKAGTILSNLMLGSKMNDMTSGFQGFHASIVEKFVRYRLLSEAHFYQTELRYLLRKTKYVEIPISYRVPSPSVSRKAIYNSISVLIYYFFLRLKLKSPSIK